MTKKQRASITNHFSSNARARGCGNFAVCLGPEAGTGSVRIDVNDEDHKAMLEVLAEQYYRLLVKHTRRFERLDTKAAIEAFVEAAANKAVEAACAALDES